MSEINELIQTLDEFDVHANFPIHDTPYSEYAGTNYVASDLEIPTIRDIVSQYRDQLVGIDSILDIMHSIIEELDSTREQIASLKTEHEGYISRIRRLPAEILSDIFLYCLPNQRYITLDAEAAPLLLTGICTKWQTVALNTPRLWCSLSISDLEEEQLLLLHDHWFKHAKLFPLALEINLISDIGDRSWPWNAIIAALPHIGQCKELSINFADASGLNELLGHVPNLVSLTLTGDMDTLKSESISIEQPDPCLHTLCIDSPNLDAEALSTFHPGWAHLTRLEIRLERSIVSHLFFTLLQTCPNLDHLVVSHLVIHPEDGTVSFTHQTLRILEIGDLHHYAPTSGMFSLPNLSHLLLGNSRIDANTTFDNPPISEPSFHDEIGNRVLHMTVQIYDLTLDINEITTIFNPDWTDLTHLKLDIHTSPKFCLIPLQFCPRLDSMILFLQDAWSRRAHHTSTRDPFTHSHLRSLKINMGCDDVAQFLDAFTLPSLCHLEILQNRRRWPHAAFKHFLARSQCPLERLKIKATSIPGVEREEIVSLIPTLKVTDFYDNRDSFEAWARKIGVDPCW